ncbi:MAG: MBL fold metallo-hydrolase [Deltaproteobacteria bacterium]|nr:MBL fold metallo-hydrolase [Deltaproteobacteria bacterium]
MATHRIADGLFLVDLDLTEPEGFRRFLSAWVILDGPAAVVVDPGPAATLPALLAGLDELGVARVEAVLLTHNHAGGTGLLLQRHPRARVVCHSKAVPHLVDPSALWEGSRKVLGSLAEAYGPIAPVPPERVGFCPTLQAVGREIAAFPTPGHAPHHLAFGVGAWFFAGELGGVRYPLPAGDYWRPATPPPFRHDVFQESLDAVKGVGGDLCCLGHYGAMEGAEEVLALATEQLELWIEAVRRHRRTSGDEFEGAVLADLRAEDPRFGRFSDLPADVRKRERYFLSNTLKGLRGWVEKEG